MVNIVRRSFNADAADGLAKDGVMPLLARVLAARGVVESTQLDVSLAKLIPPDALTNAPQMAVLLADAILQKQAILVVGDYDCDGATATAVAMRGLRSMGAAVDYLVPNRFEYGYGLTPEIVELAAKASPDIIITVDNGIASVEGVEKAKAQSELSLGAEGPEFVEQIDRVCLEFSRTRKQVCFSAIQMETGGE